MQFLTRKAVFLLSLGAALSFGTAAQSLDEGIKMVNYERYTSAEKILQPMAAGNPLANYYLGLTYLGEEKMADAEAAFAKYPDDAANMAGMARVAFLKKDNAGGTAKANAVAEKAKKKEWQPLVWAADAFAVGHNYQDAVRLYEEALKRGGDNVGVRIGLGDAYQNIPGGGGKAMDNYDNAVAKDPKNSLGYSRIGKLWYDARNYPDAITNWEKAKEADPSNPLPYRDLGNAYYFSGKYDLAKQNIEKYYELSDKTCDDRINYANVLFLAKDYTNAIARMQEVIGQCQGKPYMYRVLGYSQFETKDYSNALQNMRTFFQKQTDPAKIIPSDYLYMGKIYGANKNIDSTDYYFARALSADTSSNKRKTYSDIGDAYKTVGGEGGYAKAAQYYKMALDAAGDNAAAIDYYNVGFYNYVGRHYKEASDAFERMETKFPDQPTASYWRARVAAAIDSEGNTGAAVPFFQKWLSIPETEAYKRSNANLMAAYQYMAIVAYKKNDKAAMKEYIDKIKAIEPNNSLAKQLDEQLNKPAKPAAPSKPAKPAAKPKK